jgi:hypothetical protein
MAEFWDGGEFGWRKFLDDGELWIAVNFGSRSPLLEQEGTRFVTPKHVRHSKTCSASQAGSSFPHRRSFVSPSRIVGDGWYWLQGKKRVVYGAASAIESNLKIIHKFVKPECNDLAHLRVI